MNIDKESWLFKVSLISISLCTGLAAVISPAIPAMAKALPNVKLSNIELITTIPNLGVVIGLILNPFLIQKIHEKATVILGMLLAFVAGCYPLFTINYPFIMVSRFFLGLGMGIFSSLAFSLIPYFYSENKEEMAKLVGFQNTMPNLASAACSYLISYLLIFSWQKIFLVYLLILPCLILFILFVKFPRQKHKQAKKQKHHINKAVIEIAFLIFLFFVFYMPVSYKMLTLIVQEHLGTTSQYSILLGSLTLIGIPVGMSFGYLFKWLKDKLFPLCILEVLLGLFIVCFARNFIEIIISAFFLSTGFALAIPYCFNWLDVKAPHNSVNLATTIVLICQNLAMAVSPLIVNAVANMINPTEAKAGITVSTFFFVLIFIWSILRYFKIQKVK